MKLRKYVKNKKVIATVISLLVVFITTIKTYANENKEIDNNNSIRIENSIKQKEIGIKRRLIEMDNKNIKGRQMKVKATAYTGSPAEGGDMTYLGTKCREGYTIAVDPKVIPLGTRVYIPQFNKVFVAEDTGSAIKGRKIDIFMNSYNAAIKWGIREIDIIILD